MIYFGVIVVHVSQKLGSYLQGFEACQRGEKHWIMEIPEIDLYLSQLTVLSSSVAAASSTSGLLLLTQRDLPPLLCPQDSQEGEEVHEANVWANINPVSSSLHYDGNHNLLYVSSGCKVVLLVSPRHTALLRPSAAHASTPNHSALSRDQLVHILPCLQQQKNQHQEEGCRTIDAFQVTVHAGDCLFIPEGIHTYIHTCLCGDITITRTKHMVVNINIVHILVLSCHSVMLCAEYAQAGGTRSAARQEHSPSTSGSAVHCTPSCGSPFPPSCSRHTLQGRP